MQGQIHTVQPNTVIYRHTTHQILYSIYTCRVKSFLNFVTLIFYISYFFTISLNKKSEDRRVYTSTTTNTHIWVWGPKHV